MQFSGMGQWDANVVHNWYLKYHSSPEFVFETDLLSISSESYRMTEMSVSFKMSGKVQISDRRVKFCSFCNGRNNCQRCENNIEGKGKMSSTAFYQMKDVACYISGTSNEMIADLGCPNSVIAMKDENNFVSNLSEYQRTNLEVVQVDE